MEESDLKHFRGFRWQAQTGTSEPVSYKIVDGCTSVPLQPGPWGTAFVDFRRAVRAKSRALPAETETQVGTKHRISQHIAWRGWGVRFQ
jgi:hypothetical protein